MIKIISCNSKETFNFLKSLKLSKSDFTDYEITILGEGQSLSKLEIDSRFLIGNDFKIKFKKYSLKNSPLLSIFTYILESSENFDKVFLCKSIICNKDLFELTKFEFGNMLVQASGYPNNKLRPKVEYLYSSDFIYLNAEKIKSEGILSEILDSENLENIDDDIILNRFLYDRIMPFKTSVLKFDDVSLKDYISINRLATEGLESDNFFAFRQKDSYLLKNIIKYNNVRQCCNISVKELEELKQNGNSIVFNFDRNNLDQFIVAVSSLLEVTKDFCQIICLIRNDVDLEDKENILYKLSQLFRDKFSLTFINVDEHLTNIFSKKLFEVRGISSVAYARLFIPFLLKHFNSVIYSDCDVLFKRDPFKYLDSLELDNKFLIYGVPSIRLKGRNGSKLYINSGFLYYNLNATGSRDFVLKNRIEQELTINNLFQDQDIINKVYEDCKGKLPPVLCLIPKCYIKGIYNTPASYSLFSKSEINNLKDPVIIHWSGVEKPWLCDVGKGREWKSVRDCVMSGQKIAIEEEKIFVTQNYIRSLTDRITRKTISEIIGEENMIPKIASYPIGLVNINSLPNSFVLRKFDYSDFVICENKDKLSNDQIRDICNDRSPIFAEKFIPNGRIYSVKQSPEGLKIFNKNLLNIDESSKEKILFLANKIYNKFKEDKVLEFLVDKKEKVYFRCIS